ncbi:MAG: FkbM family methyltransferase, partial [Deltaproteobacteria bacterium]|nr:FkbM family methyltransferase [Deltaproteobacteria bacterium]
SGILSGLKNIIVPRGEAPRAIKAGPFRGLRMNLDLVSQFQIYLGLFEREVHAKFRMLSANIATAIDIGAAQGEYTLYFLAKTRAAKILAFEPSKVSRAELLSNLKLNGLASDSRLNICGQLVGPQDDGNMCSLDSLLPLIEFPCLIKMDIDGGEAEVLRGAQKLLLKPQVRWLIETHSPELERNSISLLEKFGYETEIIENAWWRFFIPEQRPIEQNRWLIASKQIPNILRSDRSRV